MPLPVQNVESYSTQPTGVDWGQAGETVIAIGEAWTGRDTGAPAEPAEPGPTITRIPFQPKPQPGMPGWVVPVVGGLAVVTVLGGIGLAIAVTR